jgi:hypothetical protein
MNDKQKRYALIAGGGLVLLYLLYQWYQSKSSANQQSSGAGVTAPDTTGSDYAALAGQEQGDVAGLQSGITGLGGTVTGLGAQEQSDVTGLQSGLTGLGGTVTGLGAQEQADVSGLTGTIGDLTGQIQNLADLQTSMGQEIAGIGVGQVAVSPSAVASTIQTHQGGPFYNYYVKVTGHPPPAAVQTSNFLYQAWKGGVSATALQAKPTAHPSAPKQTQVAHPNGNHAAQTQVAHPNTTRATTAPAPKPAAKPAPKPAPKPPPPPPPPPKPAPKPKPPPPPPKPKASGKRK